MGVFISNTIIFPLWELEPLSRYLPLGFLLSFSGRRPMFYSLEVVVVAHLSACITKSDLGTLWDMFTLCMKVSILWTVLLISFQVDVSIWTSRIRDHTKGYTWKSYIRKVLGNTGTLHKLCRQPVPTKGLFQMSQSSLLIAKDAYLAVSTKIVLPI